MIKNNFLHIFQSDLLHQSRLYKIIKTQSKNKNINKIFAVGIKKDKKLDVTEKFLKKVKLKRMDLLFSKLSKNYLSYTLKSLEYLIRNIIFVKKHNINIISIHHVFLIPFAIYFKYFHSCKIIYDTHELETEAVSIKGYKKLIAKFLEKNFIKQFDHVFVTSDEIFKWYKKKYQIKNMTKIFNCLYFRKLKKKNYLRKKFKINSKRKIFIYLGALSDGRGIDIILETFSKLKNKNAVVIFIGYGKNKDKIKNYAKANTNIFFHDAVEFKDILQVSSSADFGLSLVENTCLNEQLMLPNKIFEYVASGIPVITSNLMQSAKIVKKNKLGYVIKPSPKTLKKLVMRLIEKEIFLNRFELLQFSKNYSWKFNEIKINKILDTIIKTST